MEGSDIRQRMEGLSLERNSLAADIQDLIQGMECIRIEGSSLAADMPELNKSTKAAQEAHSENKNKEVAKPELESEEKPMRIIDMAAYDPAKLEYMPFYDHLYPLFGGIDED